MTEKKESQPLSARQKKHLKGLGHKLSPLVLIGKEGISERIIEATQAELQHHELIKVKIGSNSEVSKQEAADTLPILTKSILVQLIGKTVLLYKKNPKRPKDKRIYLPRD